MKLEANVKFEREETIRFLESEYAQCFDQMRHYDNVGKSYIEFALTGYVAIISGLSALFKYLEETSYREILIGGLLLFLFLAGMMILALIVKNRGYYVTVARQVNSIRNYFLNNSEEIDFIKYNKCKFSSDSPSAFNKTSTYTLLFLIIALINSCIAGFGLFFILSSGAVYSILNLIISIVFMLIILTIQITLVVYSLRGKDIMELDKKVAKEKSGGE